MKMGEMGRKGGLGDFYGKFPQLHLHCICIRRKPHGLIAQAWGKSLPGPAHGLEPTAQQLRPLCVTKAGEFSLIQPAALYAFINKVIDFSYGCDILFIFRPRVASRQMPDNTTHLGRLVWALDLEGIRKPS